MESPSNPLYACFLNTENIMLYTMKICNQINAIMARAPKEYADFYSEAAHTQEMMKEVYLRKQNSIAEKAAGKIMSLKLE